jgi:structural maintenance of chromosome 3 (chondroitin sulfate proteoglycan 6)
MIQIELNESLRRRRDELRSEIEGLGEPEIGDASAADDLKVRTHEMSTVNNAISTLTKRVQGAFFSSWAFSVVISQYNRHGERN